MRSPASSDTEEMQRLLAPFTAHPLPQLALQQLELYLQLLLRWNSKFNLTALRDRAAIITVHFGEGVFFAHHLPPGPGTLLDFGSGAGIPGIPVQIVHPEAQVTLLEAQQKKAAFLHEVVRTLALPTNILAMRGEEVTNQYDFVLLRAVEHMRRAVKTAASLVIPGGQLRVLTTSDRTYAIQADVAECVWQPPIPLPQTLQKVLLVGRKRN